MLQEWRDDNQDPFWLSFYSLLIIVILPSIVNVVFNILIYFSVRSSTRRVHALATITSVAARTNHRNARDIYLLKHMFFVFVVFVLGWTPIYFLALFNLYETVTLWVIQFLQILPVISSLVIVLDLFFYNRDLRQDLKERLMKFFHLN